MSFLSGGAPSVSTPSSAITPLPVPTKSDAEVQDAATAERQRLAGAAGRRSTLLTGLNDNAQAPDRKPTLLGRA